MNLLRHFIIGGSFPIVFSFYYSVFYQQPKKNYSYFNYSMIAPVYLGLFNVILNVVGNKYKWSMLKRYLIFSIISWLTTITISTNLKSYNFTPKEWNRYYIYLLTKYIIVWNILVINLEKNI